MVIASPMAPAAPAGEALERALQLAGSNAQALRSVPPSLTRPDGAARGLPLVEALLRDPLHAAQRVGLLEGALRERSGSVADVVGIASRLAGAEVSRAENEARRLYADGDPLAVALEALFATRSGGHDWRASLPAEQSLGGRLRLELARVLGAMVGVERFRQRALARVPAAMDRQRLLRQVLGGRFEPFESPDVRAVLPLVEREALMAGLQDLVRAVERLAGFLRDGDALQEVEWRIDTPLGEVLVDTRHASSRRQLAAPLLLVDVGGDDEYSFIEGEPAAPIRVLIDVDGADRYRAEAVASGPSSAVLGYGVLWDTAGDDHYQGHAADQAAAILGGALLVDEGGRDRFEAAANAQAYAFGGLALLIERSGDDHYRAMTHAQASAGPGALALLLELGGDDDYQLAPTPLLQPSSQLPDRNTSMGQGAGRGLRADRLDGRSLGGGVGALFDAGGDDRYAAAVFAQGAAFWRGAGLLVDGGGRDSYRGNWYVQGAAAHDGAAVMIDRGGEGDRYSATHSTSLAAAHDGSAAVLVDEGGSDHYSLGGTGLGAALDGSVAIFADNAGGDIYELAGPGCAAFGAAPLSAWRAVAELGRNVALFVDAGGRDDYPSHCRRVGDGAAWAWPRRHPQLGLRSESGAGVDGEMDPPLATGGRIGDVEGPR